MCAAYGVESATPLAGGQGTTYGNGDVVLKPVIDVEEAEWLAAVLFALPEPDRLRIIRPVTSASGEWVVGGWSAWQRLGGTPRSGAWRETVAVSRQFHEVVAAVPWSSAIARHNPWARGDQLAWGERGLDVPVPANLRPTLDRLRELSQPLDLSSQLVHRDVLHNVLFDDTLPPAVIDVSPAWRPARYAEAIVVVDAIGWDGAPPGAIDALADDEGVQLLVRATLFRLASAVVLCEDDPDRLDAERATYERVVDALECVLT